MDSNALERIYFGTDVLPKRDRIPAVREEFARRLLNVECANRGAKPFSAKFGIDQTFIRAEAGLRG